MKPTSNIKYLTASNHISNLKWISLLFILVIQSLQVYSQGSPVTEYYNAIWKRCDKADHEYYRIIQYKAPNKPLDIVRDYYKNGQIFREGKILSLAPTLIYDGPCTWYYASGQKKETILYDKGSMEGEHMEWFENGKKRETGSYLHNKREGLHTWFYSNGQKATESNFTHGLKEGESLNWYDDGKIWKKSFYLNDSLEGNSTYYFNNGNKQENIFYHRGRKEGERKAWFPDGVLMETSNYLHDTLNGIQSIYNNASILKLKATYKNGRTEGPYFAFNDKGQPILKKDFTEGPFRISSMSYYQGALMYYDAEDTVRKVKIIYNARMEIGQSSMEIEDIAKKQKIIYYSSGELQKSSLKKLICDSTWYPNGQLEYARCEDEKSGHFESFNKWDESGKLIEYILPDSLFVQKYKDNTQCLFGIKDWRNNKIGGLKYMMVYDFVDQRALVQANDGKYGAIDMKGNEIIPVVYTDLENLIPVNRGQEFSIDTNISKPLYRARLNGKWGIIDWNNRIIIPFEYDRISEEFTGERFIVARDGLRGLANKHGIIFQPKYPQIEPELILDRYIQINDGNTIDSLKRYGLIDTSGKLVLPTIYNDISVNRAFGNLIILTKDNMCGIFSTTAGKIILPLEYTPASGRLILKFSGDKYLELENMTCVFLRKKGKVGWLDKNGKWIFKPKYNLLIEVSRGNFQKTELVIFKDKNKYGLLDTLGKIRIPAKYENLASFATRDLGLENILFSQSFFVAEYKGKTGIINEKDSIILPLKYDRFISMDNNEIILVKDGRVSYLSLYDMIEHTESKKLYFRDGINGIGIVTNSERKVLLNSNRYMMATYGDGLIRAHLPLDIENASEYDYNGNPIPDNLHYKIKWPQENGYAYLLSFNGKVGVINPKKELILDTVYNAIRKYNPYDSGFWVMSDSPGSSTKYRNASNKTDSFYLSGGWAFADTNGKMLTRAIYETPEESFQSFAKIKSNGKYFLMPANGKPLPGLVCDTLDNITASYPLCYFTNGKTKGLIDSSGRIVSSGHWDKFHGYFGSYGLYFENGNPGLLDSTGKIIFSASKNEIAGKSVDLGKYLKFPNNGEIVPSVYEEDEIYSPFLKLSNIIENYDTLNTVKDVETRRKISNAALIMSIQGIQSTDYDRNFIHEERNASLYSRILNDPDYYDNYVEDTSKIDSNCDYHYSVKIEAALKNIFGLKVAIMLCSDRSRFYNFKIEGNNLHRISLRELFDSTQDYKIKLNKILAREIKKLEDIDLNCFQSGQYSDLLKSSFIIKDKGISFFIQTESDHSLYYELQIPYNELKSFINPAGPLKEL